MQEFRRIAVVRSSGLGDYIFSLPALTALKETFPKAQIVYLGKKWHQDFLSKRFSPVDKVIVIPPVKGVGMEESYVTIHAELQKFYRAMHKEQFDLAIQLHGGGKYSNGFTKNLGARMTIGTKTDNALQLDKSIPYHYYQSEIARCLEVVGLVGAKTARIMPSLNITMFDTAEAIQLLLNKNKFIVLHPGATDLKRQWPCDCYAKIGDYFAKKGFTIVITGSGDEKNIVQKVINHMEYPAENFYNKLSLNGLAGLLSLANVVVANDTGPLHLADAVGTKTVGLYWGPNLINAAPFFRSNNICLSSWIVRCPLCNRDCVSEYPFEELNRECQHETSFITGISTGDVITAVESFL